MPKKLNGLTFKILIIQGIVYVQFQRWVIKLTFKRKAFGESLMSQGKKLFYVKGNIMCTGTFVDAIFYIFDKWRRRVQKKY